MTEEERTWNYVLRLLSLRPRTCAELRLRLLRRGYGEELVTKLLAKAEEEGLVDDQAFARLYAEERLALHPRPRRVVAAELRARGVEAKLAGEAVRLVLPEVSEEALARRALAGKKPRWERLPQPLALRRAYAFLLRRGFSPELSRKIAEEAFGPWTSESE